MRAALYMGQKNIEMANLPVPECGENDILLKNIYASICGTDVAVYLHGPNTGHRVTVGGFSEYVLAPDVKLNEGVYLVPEGISDKVACLIEPFTVGCRAARRSNPKRGEKAIIFGCGTIGIAAAMALKYFGKSSSIHGETADVDIYIDAAGAKELIETYQKMGKIESRLVVVAVLAGYREINVLDMTYSQHAIIGSGGYMPEDVMDVFAIMQDERWDIEKIITDVFPWEMLPDAIERAADSQNTFNVVIQY